MPGRYPLVPGSTREPPGTVSPEVVAPMKGCRSRVVPCSRCAQRPPTQPSSFARATTPDHGYAARKSSRISDSAHKSLDCHTVGVSCDSWPRPAAAAVTVLIRAFMAPETPRERGSCVVRLGRRRTRFTVIRVHDKRVYPHAKEKPA